MFDWAAGSKSTNPVIQPADPAKVQGSPEWHAFRLSGIGSSDSAVLLGWSPWKTIHELLLEKQGKWSQEFGERQQSAMERGKRLEPTIRAWYERKTGALFPDDTGVHSTHPILRASYDGINRAILNEDMSVGRLIEIKTANKLDHASVMNKQKVPTKYQPQCQWLMLVSGIPTLDYVSYGSDDTYGVVRVTADRVLQNELLERALDFWSLVDSKAEAIYGERFTLFDPRKHGV